MTNLEEQNVKITGISVYQIDLPLYEGSYNWSAGNSVSVFDSTVVRIDTDEGVAGYGEICPLGPAYLPAYAAGARGGIAELSPSLLGMDPTKLNELNLKMDKVMRGHNYVKSAIDMACWDILGKVAELPVCTLLGGRFGDEVQLYRAISQVAPEDMAKNVEKYRSEGYHKFQLKVGGTADEDILRIRAVAASMQSGEILVADANTGWLMHDAIRVVNAVKDLDIYIEQPCMTYEECLAVRQHTQLPFIMDEVMDNIQAIVRAANDHAVDAINLKISKVGGLTKARQIRDLCVALGIPMNIEDTWGGDITTAAIAHLAQSTPPDLLLMTTDFNGYVTVSFADGAPRRKNGRMSASTAPGLGVRVRHDVLGEPVFALGRATAC